jgi:2-oxoisovalerate dehydrogenase E1 component
LDVPLVARTRVGIGSGYGGQHSMDPVALYALFPGWRVVYPSNAFDYIGLFNSAMRSLDPTLIVEHQALYSQKFPVPEGDLDYCIPFGKARVVNEGGNMTIVAYGPMVGRCERITPTLESQNISAEIIDLRTVDPADIDYPTIGLSVAKTGAILIVEEAPRSQSIGAILAAEITERFFDDLDCPVCRLASHDVPSPVSRVLEAAALLDDACIVSAVVGLASRRLVSDRQRLVNLA